MKELINIEELSELLGFKKSYIYKLLNERKLPYYKPFGKKVFFKRSEILEILESSKSEAVNTLAVKDKADSYFLR